MRIPALVGVASSFPAVHQSGGDVQEGDYVGAAAVSMIIDAACPYCHTPMVELLQPSAKHPPSRVVKTLRRSGDTAFGLVQFVPESHRIVACGDCQQFFTIPKSADTEVDAGDTSP